MSTARKLDDAHPALDAQDRAIINTMQGGFPVSEHPFADAAAELGMDEDELIGRLRTLLAGGVLSRFGPLYHAQEIGGALVLAAMRIPPEDFARVTRIVNAFPEVAHNYEREHALNMWFVVATETAESAEAVFEAIEARSGYDVYRFPKRQEFFVGLNLQV